MASAIDEADSMSGGASLLKQHATIGDRVESTSDGIEDSVLANQCDIVDVEGLRDRLDEVNSEFLETSAQTLTKSSAMQSLQLGQATIEMLFPATSCELPINNPENISAEVGMTTDLVSSIQRMHQEMNELQSTLSTINRTNTDLMKECRQLMHTYQQEARLKSSFRGGSVDPLYTQAQVDHSHLVDKLGILQNCFQGLILGSSVNWNDHEELRNVVLELGQTLEDSAF